MKSQYECLMVLDTKGKEDGAKDIIERLEKEFAKDGAKIEQVQRLEKRQFAYSAGELDGGYYVNFIFQAEPGVIDKLRNKLKLDSDVYRQYYQKLKPKKVAAAA